MRRSVTFFLSIFVLVISSGCTDILEKSPPSELNEKNYWQSKEDATRALMGVYSGEGAGLNDRRNGWGKSTIYWTDGFMSDIGIGRLASVNYIYRPTEERAVENPWSNNYIRISRANYFLNNIDRVNSDLDGEKPEMIAEVKFIRSYAYFWLSQLFGNVPLTEKVLTFDEANSLEQAPKDSVENFVIRELTEAARDLPIKRPDSELGRIEKGAALALKGRLLMAQERWSEAAATYREIMNLNRYTIEPQFKALFEDEMENNDEYIWAIRYKEGEITEQITQDRIAPNWFGGESGFTLYQNFVDTFLMTDGETIEESPLYDPDQPFDNRDPRFYKTILLPAYSVVNDELYYGHPDSAATTGDTWGGITGYVPNKFYDPDYEGNPSDYGGDYPIIRYPEVLLSRLESELKAGNTITQGLLDNTINQIRQRDSVAMPPVEIGEDFSTDEELMDVIRRERVVELALEGGLRFWDLLRWEMMDDVFNRDFYGMKLTDDPTNYTGGYSVNDEGHLIVHYRRWEEHWYLRPIPQNELDVNSNLEQNPGY